jgi:hypothetical protein
MMARGLQEEVLVVTTGAAAPGSDLFLLVAEAEEVVVLGAVAGPWGQAQVGQQVPGVGWAALHLLGWAVVAPTAAAAVGGVLL